ncbi:hypothetical protein D3C80_1323020 [compost metagenome]
MQMVVTELMLDNFLRLLMSVNSKLLRIDLYIMTFGKIPSARRRQSAVKAGLVPERHAEAAERYPLDPLLQLLVAHTDAGTGHSVRPLFYICKITSPLEL